MTPADELCTAAAKMRTLPGPAAEPIAKLLEAEVAYVAEDSPTHPTHLVYALAVARAINGSSDG